MALTREAKTCLWAALRLLRYGKYAEARKQIEDALVFLELDRSAIDPGMK